MATANWRGGRAITLGLVAATAGIFALTRVDASGRSAATHTRADARPAATRSQTAVAGRPDDATRRRAFEQMARLPLRFEANTGQASGDAQFTARGLDYGLRLAPGRAEIAMAAGRDRGAAVHVTLPGANTRARVTGLDSLPGVTHYYRGSDAAAWRTGVRTYARVRYEGVYPGIDLVYYGNQDRLEYDFVLAPGADPSTIRLRPDGVSRIEIAESGDLLLHVAGGEPIRQERPITYQTIDGARREVPSRYVLHGREVGFEVGAYDRGVELTIDPVIVYSTFFGGNSQETIYDMALDPAGNIYVTGTSQDAAGFPTTPGAFQAAKPGIVNTSDAFVSKFNSSGSALVYSTFLGGSGDENNTVVSGRPARIAVDAAGNAYVAGVTQSANFPVSGNAADPTYGGTSPSNSPDGFYVKFSPTGGFLYGTFIGGTDRDFATGIGVDAAGNVYVSGFTRSDTVTEGFVTTAGAHQTAIGGAQDNFLVKFDTNGARTYATYIGGTGAESIYEVSGSLAVAPNGICYVTGDTASTNFPIVNGRQGTNGGGQNDVYLAKYDTTIAGAGALLYSTYLGGNNDDSANSVVIAGGGTVFLAGQTRSANFPIQGGLFPTFQGGLVDAFVAKVDTTLAGAASLTYSTFLGGTANDNAWDVAVDAAGGARVAGDTQSADFPMAGPVLSTFATIQGFLSELNPAGSALTFSTYYLPGGNFKTVTTVVVDANGNSLIAGGENNVLGNPPSASGFPLVNAFQTTYGGGDADGFIARFGNPLDTDNDGLPTDFETRFGLDPNSGLGNDGAAGDPDGDGLSNLQELTQGSHPRGFVITFLAEGATGTFFDTRIAIANPTAARALVLTRFQKDGGAMIPQYTVVQPHSRATIDVEGLTGMESAAFSSLIEADVQVVADRTMTWGAGGYGSHAERGILTRTSTTWYLAEGATHGAFDLFYLLQNPGPTEAQVEISFLRPAPAPPIVRPYTLPPTSRVTIYLDQIPGLEQAEVSASLRSTNGVPFIAERSMYFSLPGQPFAGGHESAGVTAAATRWFLAEGATGTFFHMFILVANPSPQDANVEMQYLLANGQVVTRTHPVAANSRFTLNVATEGPELASAAVSTIVTSTNSVPIVVERAMWWPASGGPWYEAHNSPGETTTGTRWAMAEGESGGPSGKQTYILIANTSAFAGSARVTLLFEDGTTAQRTYNLAANSRLTVSTQVDFPATADKRYGALIESLGATPAELVVERAMYSNADGVIWAAGTNALATKLP